MEKTDRYSRAAELEREKKQGRILFYEMYMFDWQVLLSHRKLRGFQVHERVLTFPALSVWTSTGMTKETWWTSRETFKEAQGVCKRPCVIESISVLTLAGLHVCELRIFIKAPTKFNKLLPNHIMV